MKETPNHDKGTLAKWLDTIQQDSWQLELIISGFSIFLLLGAGQLLWDLEYDLVLLQQTSEQFFLLDAFYYTSRMGYMALLSCLLFHVVLRGLWIAAVGLRSVSGDIEYEKFKYRPLFVDRLRRGIGSFDDYIERLERYCSILFSFAFLIIFCFLSVALFAFFIVAFGQSVAWLVSGVFADEDGQLDDTIANICFAVGFIYAIDFMSLGYLKRLKWLGKVYYYWYVFMGWITLARFYRPLYYNLIDNRFGRKFALALPITVLTGLLFSSLHYSGKTYMPGYTRDGSAWISSSLYDDTATNPVQRSWRISLPSRKAKDNYVDLFVPYVPINDDGLLKLVAPDLVTGRNAGFYLQGGINWGDRNNPEADNQALLQAFRASYRLYVNDSLSPVAPRFFYNNHRRQHGVLYPIPVHDLAPGEHSLRLDRRQYRKDSVLYTPGRIVYFYK